MNSSVAHDAPAAKRRRSSVGYVAVIGRHSNSYLQHTRRGEVSTMGSNGRRKTAHGQCGLQIRCLRRVTVSTPALSCAFFGSWVPPMIKSGLRMLDMPEGQDNIRHAA